MSPSSVRGAIVTAMLIGGAIGTALGALLLDATHGVLDADAFAERTVQSLDDPRVAALAADQITDAVLKARPDLTGVRPIIQTTAGGLVSSTAFRAVLENAVRRVHGSVLSAGGEQVLLSLPDVGALIRNALASLNPELAAKVPVRLMTLATNLEARAGTGPVRRILRAAERLSRLGAVLLVVGGLLLVAAVAVATDRRTALVRAGQVLLVAGVVVFLALPAGRVVAAALSHTPLERGALIGLWRSYFGGLLFWSAAFGGIGVLLIAAGTSLLENPDPLGAARRLLARMTIVPRHPWQRIAWAFGLVLLGSLSIVFPSDAAAVVTTLLGLGLVYWGLCEFFGAILGAMPDAERVGVTAPAGRRGRRLTLTLATVAVLGAVVFALVRARPARATAAPVVVAACNGAAALCDRTVDQVVFPSSHNAMANEDMIGWLFPQQETGMTRQLADGIRGLLFDIHAGVPAEDNVVTDLDVEKQSREKIARVVGDSAVAAALRIRARLLGKATGPWQPYLCHGYCETGHFALVPQLEDIRGFLVANPAEVLVMVIEDYIPVERIAQAFDESHLLEFVYQGPVGPPWPTLRSLIGQNGRVIVFIESGTPGVAWLYPAFETIQETPYTFHRPEDFSCKANRGPASGSLFQINHWIETTPAPRPSNAAIVNAYDFLLKRARTCERDRKRRVNLLAVDFYRTGDVFRVARTLNGLDSAATP